LLIKQLRLPATQLAQGRRQSSSAAANFLERPLFAGLYASFVVLFPATLIR
jgi:hypothetical protein